MDDPFVTETIAQLPGMATGELGMSGMGKSGPNVRTMVIPFWKYIGIEISWTYLHTLLGLMMIDGLGLADLAPPGEALEHIYTVGGLALAPTFFSLLNEAYRYLSKVRISRNGI
jgi:hypothetical protein